MRDRVRRRWRSYLVLLWLGAFALRQVPLVLRGRWAGEFNADEGVYFGAAQQFVHGHWPYAEFLLVHPPGITLFLAPFAGLAEVVSDPVAAGLARTAISALGATSAVLVALLLRRYGWVGALAGSVLYAVWTATVWTEWMILLDPLLAVAMLSALLLLRRDSPRTSKATVAAGIVLGLALTVKLWAAIPLVVIAVTLFLRDPSRRGLARVLGFGLGAAGAVAVVLTPFVAVAGLGPVWRDIVGFQLGRPVSDGPPRGTRIGYFGGSLLAPERLSSALWLCLALAVLALVGLAVVVAARNGGARLRESEQVLWLALAVAQTGGLLAAPSFYYHYTLVAAPALCLVAGSCAQVLVDRVRRANVRRMICGVCAAIAIPLLVMSARQVGAHTAPVPDWSVLKHVVGASEETCVWAPHLHVLIEADLSGQQARNDCPITVDVYATVVDEVGAVDLEFETLMPRAHAYQARIAGELVASSLVIVDEQAWARFADSNRALIERDFTPAASAGRFTIWRRIEAAQR